MNDDITLQELLDASELMPALWAEKYEMKNEAGLPLDFDGKHRFMRQPFNDMSPLQAWLKPPQIGATTTQILKALYVAYKQNRQIIYTLPTQGDVYEMVSGSFNRLIAQNPILSSWVAEGDTMGHKFVGSGMLRFRGTYTDKQAMMYPSSLNIHDEVDASDASIITLMETRLMSNPVDQQWRWYFSHPSDAGHGVDVYWQQSDKKEWFVNPTCRHENILSWPESIRNGKYVCSICGTSISDEERIEGAWQATASGSFSGYHISQLMCSWITPEQILNAFNDPLKDKKYFYNYVLGLPYADSTDIITVPHVLANVTNELNTQEDRVIIGVDTGNQLHYVLMNSQGVFNFGATQAPSAGYDPYAFLEGFLKRWPRSLIVFDAQGDVLGPQQMQANYPGRIFRCWYLGEQKTLETIKWGEAEKLGEVKVDRERMMQLTVEQLKDARYKLNGTIEEWKPFAEHWANMIRVETASDEELRRGITKKKWQKNGGRPDHWAHALLYAMVGYSRYGDIPEVLETPTWMATFKKGAGPTTTFNDIRR